MTSDIACITQKFSPMAWAALLTHFEGKIEAMTAGPDKDNARAAWEFLVENDMFRCGPWQLNVLHAKVCPVRRVHVVVDLIVCHSSSKVIIADDLIVCWCGFFPRQAHKSSCELLFSIFYKFGGCMHACVRACVRFRF